jgi:hypothetical protein
MISQKIGYSFSEEMSGNGVIEYSDTQAYPKVTFQVTAKHQVIKDKIIKYLSTPRMFHMPDMLGVPGGDALQKLIAPNSRIDFFQKALAEMNAATGIAAINQ